MRFAWKKEELRIGPGAILRQTWPAHPRQHMQRMRDLDPRRVPEAQSFVRRQLAP